MACQSRKSPFLKNCPGSRQRAQSPEYNPAPARVQGTGEDLVFPGMDGITYFRAFSGAHRPCPNSCVSVQVFPSARRAVNRRASRASSSFVHGRPRTLRSGCNTGGVCPRSASLFRRSHDAMTYHPIGEGEDDNPRQSERSQPTQKGTIISIRSHDLPLLRSS
ncbi:hypothetical protein Mpal_0906 [Methanosphaerula palustris E1-9c]|uniref:Uncharacterized protein n=1 Tax=Methanosphaerula palustris (strain ATCC BAA-1556 / DSM 19958 / E1-9c) TaxID=521011 RepID=B8GGK5_METPE|nr:hypothetical protein Mpal_0906 [Methanosphaerula palustris E1-9c]